MEKNVLIISDVHGDKIALERIREIERKFSSELILSAGDLSPDPYDPLFYSIKGARGNCDRFFEYGPIPFPPVIYKEEIYGKKIVITHGHIALENPLDYDILITGHTHVPSLKERGGKYYLNPGSIALPRTQLGPTFGILTPSFLAILSLMDLSLIKRCNFSSS